MNNKYGLIVIGGGPAGMAGAMSAIENGINNILIIEREDELGGILKQCIHNGFGLHYFKEELTGPEYAYRFINKISDSRIDVILNSTVINLNDDKQVTYVNRDGLQQVEADRILLAMGCRERTRGAILTPGYRPAGIYNAGAAQKFINIDGYLPGNKVVIVGSGDIGLIMARRMTLEGAKVELVTELMPHSSGLARNIVQCVEDYDIPLKYNTTITKIHGKDRVTGVTIAEVDQNRQPILATEKFIECDTVLFSVGLIPENELSIRAGLKLNPRTNGLIVDETMQTSANNIYACGNIVHVHDLVDNVTLEAIHAGQAMTNTTLKLRNNPVTITHDTRISYVVPDHIKYENASITLSLRSNTVIRDCTIVLSSNNQELQRIKKMIITPGEMITINLKEDYLALINNDFSIMIEEE